MDQMAMAMNRISRQVSVLCIIISEHTIVMMSRI